MFLPEAYRKAICAFVQAVDTDTSFHQFKIVEIRKEIFSQARVDFFSQEARSLASALTCRYLQGWRTNLQKKDLDNLTAAKKRVLEIEHDLRVPVLDPEFESVGCSDVFEASSRLFLTQGFQEVRAHRYCKGSDFRITGQKKSGSISILLSLRGTMDGAPKLSDEINVLVEEKLIGNVSIAKMLDIGFWSFTNRNMVATQYEIHTTIKEPVTLAATLLENLA